MVLCAVYRCSNRSGRDKVSFFRLPSIHPRAIHKDLLMKRRNLWLRRINRAFMDEINLKHIRICSKHFITGKPSDPLDDMHPDWAPSINLGYNLNSKSAADIAKYNRSVKEKLQPSNLTMQSTTANIIDDAEISNNGSVKDSVSLKMTDSLAPGNAHIIRVTPIESENGKAIEQESESENEILQEEEEEESDISEDKEMEHDPSLKEKNHETIPETEVATYLVCDANQQLDDTQTFISNLTQDNSVKLTENLHLKETSQISNTIQVTPLMSKFFERKSKVQEIDLTEKADMVFKISILENKIDHFREQHKNDKKRISALLDTHRRNLKKIAALEECIAVLKQQKCIVHAKSEILKEAPLSLLELIGRQNCQNKDKTVYEYSLEVREFFKTLYSISPDACMYVRSYFNMALPPEQTILKWLPKRKDER